MDPYAVNLIISVMLLIIAAAWHHQQTSTRLLFVSHGESSRFDSIDEGIHDLGDDTTANRYVDFRREFLRVYGLVMAADWLQVQFQKSPALTYIYFCSLLYSVLLVQGSFMYSVYRDSHRLPEPVVALLFSTGFLCAGGSAMFVGSIIDKYGRRLMCQCFCVIYSLSCLTVLSSNIWLLFVGRALGGISTTLLYTAFETWMVAEYRKRGFGHSESALSSIYSSMAILNGFIAMGSGVVAQVLVRLSGSGTAPFLASVVCLNAGLVLISRSWVENFGSFKQPPTITSANIDALKTSVAAMLGVFAITVALCFFEGSMYVTVYSWSQAIMSARSLSGTWGHPPFGLIFTIFMGSLTLGSFFFANLSQGGNSIQVSSCVLQLALSISSASLLFTVLLKSEMSRFWAFCVFEFCVGMYMPSMAFLKANMVDEERRGKLYALMRVPLNAFIVLCLGTVKEGDRNCENRFIACSSLLLLGVILVACYIPSSAKPNRATHAV